MAAWAKERDLPPSVTLDELSVTEGFVTVDGGASAHDAHLDAALSGYDKEFTALQLESGRLDGKRPAEGGAEGRD